MDLRTLINTRLTELGIKAADLPGRASRLSNGRFSVSKERVSQLRAYPPVGLTRLMTRETLLALAAALETPVEVVALAGLVSIRALPWDAKIGMAVTPSGDLVLVLSRSGCTADELNARADGAARGAAAAEAAQVRPV